MESLLLFGEFLNYSQKNKELEEKLKAIESLTKEHSNQTFSIKEQTEIMSQKFKYEGKKRISNILPQFVFNGGNQHTCQSNGSLYYHFTIQLLNKGHTAIKVEIKETEKNKELTINALLNSEIMKENETLVISASSKNKNYSSNLDLFFKDIDGNSYTQTLTICNNSLKGITEPKIKSNP